MREHLLGYLLGALEAPEHEAVEQALEQDLTLRSELDSLAATLEPLRADRSEEDPPAGLAARTCRMVVDFIQDEEGLEPQTTITPAPRREPLTGEAGPSRWTLLDLIVTAGVCAAAAMLFFPAISQSRYSSQLAICQNNLAQIGKALGDWSRRSPAQTLPFVPPTGNESAAGIYAVNLWDGQLITDSSYFVCPSSSLAQEGEGFQPVSMTELRRAVGESLHEMKRRMGGSYGYHLGCVVNGELRPTRNRSRSTFAVMADSPSFVDSEPASSNHGRCGQNVLFEDGSVRYMTRCKREGCGDVIFLNDRNEISAGLHEDDAVVAPSACTPFRTIPVGLSQ